MSIIAVDFDGTIVTHDFPAIGSPVPMALESLIFLQKKGHKIILYTMRSDNYLRMAIKYLLDNGIEELYGVNENPTQKEWTSSPKVYAHYYIDDAAVGCPIIVNKHKRPYVDWEKIMNTTYWGVI
jgi:hydroxymethylpyrimidine pyrophosphatase-like HAD family hydrolase